MILGLPFSNASIDPLDSPPLSILDILAFLQGLLPALVESNTPSTLLRCLVSTLVLILTLPFTLASQRLGITHSRSPYPWHTQPTILLDIIIYLVRHAFTSFPHSIGRAFFSEPASIPLMVSRFGGRERFEEHCARVNVRVPSASSKEIRTTEDKTVKDDYGEGVLEGWWITTSGARYLHDDATLSPPAYSLEPNPDLELQPELVLLYIHGGGLTMGSPAFYLHTLALLASSLQSRGYKRPAIFAPAYGLAPETRLEDAVASVRRAWEYMLSRPWVNESTRVGLGGDSAGGLLAMALLRSLPTRAKRPDVVL
jgi:acetyl esterase/lipase